jgi:ubiquinone biosynthesis protein UbiJ
LGLPAANDDGRVPELFQFVDHDRLDTASRVSGRVDCYLRLLRTTNQATNTSRGTARYAK